MFGSYCCKREMQFWEYWRMHSPPLSVLSWVSWAVLSSRLQLPDPRCGRWSRRHMQIILFWSELYQCHWCQTPSDDLTTGWLDRTSNDDWTKQDFHFGLLLLISSREFPCNLFSQKFEFQVASREQTCTVTCILVQLLNYSAWDLVSVLCT